MSDELTVLAKSVLLADGLEDSAAAAAVSRPSLGT